MTPVEIKAVLEKAEVNMSEAAGLFQVSRGTLYRWFNNEGGHRHKLVYSTAVRITERIKLAVDKGYLPLKESGSRKQRLIAAIREVSLERV